jgi:hypothetical protein
MPKAHGRRASVVDLARFIDLQTLERRAMLCGTIHDGHLASEAIGYTPSVEAGARPEVSPVTATAAATSTSADGTLAAAGAVPAYSSLPGAADTLYLDFDGHYEASWGQFSNITTPEFNTDGTAGFSAGELGQIEQIYRQVAEDFAPFNINVTTVEPASFADGVSLRASIGGNGAWLGQSAGGVAYVDSYTNSIANTVFVFPDNLAGNAKYVAEGVSHESGHAFGLQHQSLWQNGTKANEYYAGSGDGRAPIMGNSYGATRGLWWNGTSAVSATSIQDDMAVIARSANTFGYRGDDAGNSASTAKSLLASDTSVSAAGVIAQTTDVDAFAFDTAAGSVSFTVSVPGGVNNLDAKVELRTADGATVLASADPSDSFGATVTANVAAGSYRVYVASHGGYGDVGQYTLSGTVVAATQPPQQPTQVAAPTSLAATATDTSVRVTWVDNATDEAGYTLQRSSSSTFATYTSFALAADTTGYADAGLSRGTTYYYRVIATAPAGGADSNASNTGSATTAPNTVTSVAAAAASSSQINVSWADTAAETGYRVERSTDGGATWALAGTAAPNATSFADTGRSASTTYAYRVFATNAAGTSPASAVVTATTSAATATAKPAAPSSLRVVGATSSRVDLAWVDNATNEAGFHVDRSLDGKKWTRVATLGTNTTAWSDTAVVGGRTYWYRVRSYNSVGASWYTKTVSVKTPTATTAARPTFGAVKPTEVDASRGVRTFAVAGRLATPLTAGGMRSDVFSAQPLGTAVLA